jgi:hypothetical protein
MLTNDPASRRRVVDRLAKAAVSAKAGGSQQSIVTAMTCGVAASSLSASGAEKLGVAQNVAALAA